MIEDVKNSLKAVSETDVAACRKSNKSIKNTEDTEIRNFLAGDYWKFIYTSKYVRKKYQKLIDFNRNCFDVLSSHIDEEHFTLRCIINACVCDICGEPTAYSLANLNDNEIYAATGLLLFSQKFGYYFWDIDSVCNSDAILDFFQKNGSLPIPPLPYNNNEEQRARIATYKVAMGTIFEGRESFIEEMKNTTHIFQILSQFHDDDIENNIKKIRLQSKIKDLSIEQMLDGDPRPVDEVADLIKMRKCIVPDSFHSDSIPARCIGLLMYDSMISPDESCDDIVDRFKSTDKYKYIDKFRLFKKSDNAYISDKDNSTLKRWLKTTQNCVEKMAVLPFK